MCQIRVTLKRMKVMGQRYKIMMCSQVEVKFYKTKDRIKEVLNGRTTKSFSVLHHVDSVESF